MNIFNPKNIIYLILTIAFCFANLGYGSDVKEDNKEQLAIEMELLEKLESRFSSINEPVDKWEKDNEIEVFSEIDGLYIIRKLHEFGVHLFSVRAEQVQLKDALEQLAFSNSMNIIFDKRIEPVTKQKKIDVSLKNLPFHDILEIMTGMHGLEFVIDKELQLRITIPSNMGFESPQDYFRNKIVKSFRKLQIKYPNNEYIPESYFKLGDFFSSMGLKIIAIQEYMVVVERYPKHPMAKEALTKVAQCFMDLEDFKKAREVYNEFIERYPLDESLESIYLSITTTWFEQEKYDVAILLYKKILEMYPMSKFVFQIRERMASAYMKLEEFEKAFDILIAMKKEIGPADWDVEKDFMIGECLYQMEKLDDAFIVFTSIIGNKKLNEDRLRETVLRQAECLYRLGHYIEAIQAYKKWTQISDDDVYGMLSIGKCLRRIDLYPKAIEILKDALGHNDGDEYRDQIKFELAMSYYDNSQYDEAIELFTDIAMNEESDQYIDSNFYGAESLYGKKKYKDAIPIYKKLVTLMEEGGDRLKYVEGRLALCYQNLGLYSKALNTYKKDVTVKK